MNTNDRENREKMFYEDSIPRIADALDRMNKNLEKLTEKIGGQAVQEPTAEKDGVFRWAEFAISDEILADAEAITLEDDERGADLFCRILEEIESDADKKGWKLVNDYRLATKEQRCVIDGIFTDLCGWSLASIIRRYVIGNENKKAAWQGKSGTIFLARTGEAQTKQMCCVTDPSREGQMYYEAYLPNGRMYKAGGVGDDEMTMSQAREQVCVMLGWDPEGWKRTDFSSLDMRSAQS